jgi:hypothetical protein
MIWWLYRGVMINNDGIKITLAKLRKLVGLLRWYQTVIPFSSTYALQGLLTDKERKAAGVTKRYSKLINIRMEAAREIMHWRFIVGQGLANEKAWTSPFWFIGKASSNEAELQIWTDAATTVGGGYHLPLLNSVDKSVGHFGQFLWSDQERQLFGATELQLTDINILEFVTAILAIITERSTLRGRIVRINVDNTAAISWLNKLRAKHEFGQLWVALVVTVLLEYNIIIICMHIPGVANIIADDLSRFLQECRQKLLAEGYLQSTMPSTDSRLDIWKGSSVEGDATRTFIRRWLTKVV